MARIQVLLTDSQNEKLTYLAKSLKTTKSKLIREAVDYILRLKVPDSSDPILELVGQAGKAGRTDISERHDNYLGQKEKNGWSGKGSL